MVLVRSRRDGRTVLLREPYNIIEYAGEPERTTYIEGLASPNMDLVTGRSTKVMPEEAYDDIRVYDGPPFLPNARFGSVS